MTSIELMADLFRSPNGALTIYSVVADFEHYKLVYTTLRDAIGETDWPYARSLHTARLVVLEGRQYPDLYTAVMEAASLSEGFSSINYSILILF